ncbi:MAG: toprim domain-containing protein [Proteobacteria bacterium]|nr:toprim domain-containing protein [Pseudomonadota bacterium]
MTAEIIATALGGRKTGRCWMARCPAHDDRDPSLSIATGKDGKVLLRCHAGCDQAQVIDALWGRGLWEPRDRHADRRHAYKLRRSAVMAPERDDATRTEAARRIWQASAPAPGTLIETYLQSRGLHPPLPPTLRFHTGLKHPSGGIWPAMVTLVTRGGDDTQFAIHRTFLTRDGTGKIPVEPQKMMLGPCRGGAVRLAPSGEHLAVAEGIETALSIMQATGVPTWAALSAGGIKSLILPPLPLATMVTITADHDAVGLRAAHDAAERWTLESRRVRIALPPEGQDFNDFLREEAA